MLPTAMKPLQTYLWGLVLENPWPAHFFQVHFISELTFQLEKIMNGSPLGGGGAEQGTGVPRSSLYNATEIQTVFIYKNR